MPDSVAIAARDEVRRRAHNILRQAAGRPGHILNLGHGIVPSTPVVTVQQFTIGSQSAAIFAA